MVFDYTEAATTSYLTKYMIVLFSSSVLWIFAMKVLMKPSGLRSLLTSLGVNYKRIKRAIQEIERKCFHLCGLLVPLIYILLLDAGFSVKSCSKVCWTITLVGCVSDVARINSSFVQNNWPLKSILRAHEQNSLSGGCFFSLGCTISISLFPPSIAVASMLFLVVGDLSAALIGVSFGGEKCVIKLGRKGKKSMEGSAAMFLVCFVMGCVLFRQVNMREYPCFVGAFVATVVELYEPFGLNDNLTIPIFTSLALSWSFERIASCSPQTIDLNNWFNDGFGIL